MERDLEMKVCNEKAEKEGHFAEDLQRKRLEIQEKIEKMKAAKEQQRKELLEHSKKVMAGYNHQSPKYKQLEKRFA